MLTTTVKQRPAEVAYVDVEVKADPVWHNPCQVEDGLVLLEDSLQRNFRYPGVEGLSVVIDKHERMHVVYWITANDFPYPALGRDRKPYTAHANGRPAKKPLAVHTLPLGTTDDDALKEMRSIAQGMTRVARDGQVDDLLPWMAADLDSLRPSRSVPEISGSHEWLAAIADQRATGQTYRPHGAESDD
jgi:hypothetical protein